MAVSDGKTTKDIKQVSTARTLLQLDPETQGGENPDTHTRQAPNRSGRREIHRKEKESHKHCNSSNTHPNCKPATQPLNPDMQCTVPPTDLKKALVGGCQKLQARPSIFYIRAADMTASRTESAILPLVEEFGVPPSALCSRSLFRPASSEDNAGCNIPADVQVRGVSSRSLTRTRACDRGEWARVPGGGKEEQWEDVRAVLQRPAKFI